MKRNIAILLLLCVTCIFVSQVYGSERPQATDNTIVIQPSTQPTDQPVVVKQTLQIDETKILLWTALGAAGILGFFKLVDMVIERIGNTKRLLVEQGLLKKQVQVVAQNTDQLNRVANPNNPQTAVDPSLAAITSLIGTGDNKAVVNPSTDTTGQH